MKVEYDLFKYKSKEEIAEMIERQLHNDALKYTLHDIVSTEQAFKIMKRRKKKMIKCRYYKQCRCYGQKGMPEVDCHGDVTECEATPAVHYIEDPHTIFKKRLIIALKEYTNDHIKCYLTDDDLIIEIYYHQHINHIYKEMSISSKIMSGLTADELAEKIAKQYKDILLYRHFKKKF